jgi:ABC-type multidrug transport system fused ATPase/permease subunit
MTGLTRAVRPVAYPVSILARTVSTKLARGGRAGGKTSPSPSSVASTTSSGPDLTPVREYNSPDVLAQLPHFTAASNRFLFFWMFRFLKPVKGVVFFACLWLTLAVAVEIFVAKWIERAVNRIQSLGIGSSAPGFMQWFWRDASPDARSFRHVMLILLGLMLATLLLRYLKEVANTKMSMHLVYFIREAVYDKLQRVGFAFHDALSSGQLINRALSDLQNVRAFVQTAVLTTLDIVLAVGGYIILMITINPWLALLSLVPLPIWIYYILRFSKVVQPAAKSVMESEDRNVSLITEAIAGVHVIKAFATERQETDKYDRNLGTYLDRTLKRIRLFADFTPVIRTIAMASYLTLFLVAGILMIEGKVQAGGFLILGGAMGAILSRLQQVSTINEQYQNAMVSSRRLYEVLTAPPTVPERDDAKAFAAGKGSVRFEQVSFGYDTAKPVLHDITFDVPGGSIVAIVGPTGAGKSTLVNLITRFYDPQKGRILIDGIDVRELKLSSLRSQVSFVFQETYLFSDTAAGNIAYGRPHITGAEIEAAARLAQAHEFIETLPGGYQTMLGERGSSLSGGQKQRLAIARAILTNPRILVLDDATAAIDPETEDLIRKGMRLVMKGRTTFVIAHRISTVKQADIVIVLEGGRITQMGTHNQLMSEDGHYRDIANVQLHGDEDMPTPAEDSPSHMDRVRDPKGLQTVGAPHEDQEKRGEEEMV